MTSALVWNVESGIIDVNSEGRYNTQLAEWISNFGEAQYSYIFNETNQYTIIADSDEEDIEFNDATGEWTPQLTEYISQVIPVEGVAQVFADEGCTRYADGSSDTVYIRINENFGFNEQREWEGSPNELLAIYTPTTARPNDGYGITLWADWGDQGIDEPITSGSVYLLKAAPGATIANPKVIFD